MCSMVSHCSTSGALVVAGLAYVSEFTELHYERLQAFLTTRYLRSEAYERCMATERVAIAQFGTARTADPCRSLFSRSHWSAICTHSNN